MDDLKREAYTAMVDAAINAGIEQPDIEDIYWGGIHGQTLMYGSLSIYPDSNHITRALEAWERYQRSE